jgi:hypothetical protein
MFGFVQIVGLKNHVRVQEYYNYNRNWFPMIPAPTKIAKIANLERSRNLETTSFSLSSIVIYS